MAYGLDRTLSGHNGYMHAAAKLRLQLADVQLFLYEVINGWIIVDRNSFNWRRRVPEKVVCSGCSELSLCSPVNPETICCLNSALSGDATQM